MKIQTAILSAALGLSAVSAPQPAMAQERVMGEIITVGYLFCPRATVEAAGQLIAISQNTALFSLFGTTYGGDGRTTFGIPDLRGRSGINHGSRPGLTPFQQGQSGGRENIQLTVQNMPSHSHTGRMRASNTAATIDNPTNAALADFNDPQDIYSEQAPDVDMAANTVQTDNTGGSVSFDSRNPYLVLRYCVVTNGIYPSRN
ncbi:phage tail protein [Parasphingopyxis algicola]|uniref:phage tail protein n=1 Tax=Parasphingopyxis algicola TaxID=2026624 RepID=UPI0015A08DAB|nr:tail fiber protein [Parasphingopyxis algicola]QLC26623.1 phage tail protein [Parasphingopyxis algicola]